ncbi:MULTISPECIES: YggT family protein [Bacillaceae]|uniref:YggT family protein n=1 Tax=Bacillaceae TaxID=186817 RepID=UPI001E56F560|nr:MULTISPECIES: YggT family protein [Bacillaceae]MCE4048390.1 YggT family protein [Bacillus sp. Au-Bac7]MCM3029063.1 YggT family protein [Niallia sp. MER 6]MDL0435050.1 YggT family protein [Niallia sp. SS-2023]UPO88855.1 YggT family protein [Niallia sp. Man26]
MDLVFLIISRVLTYYSYALIIYIFMSWIPNARETGIGIFLARICEPYLEQFRKIIPPIGMIDISPIVAIFVLNLAGNGVRQLFLWF